MGAYFRRMKNAGFRMSEPRACGHRAFFLLLLFTLLPFTSFAQSAIQKGGKKINLRHADKLKGREKGKIQVLVGHVEFEHQGAVMYCDSAFLYNETNSLDAFGHVHIQHGDSLNMYGEMLKYSGNERKAELFRNISLSDGDMMLVTDYLVYDLKTKTASYNTGGSINSKGNTLRSKLGYYSSESRTVTFRKDVEVFTPEYSIKCDTLRYVPATKVAYFVGPTSLWNPDNALYCEDGFYDSKNDFGRFSKKAVLVSNKRALMGDSLIYDRKSRTGMAKGNVLMLDTSRNMLVRGDLGIYHEKTEHSLVTGHALYTQIYDNDSLFLHADTLQAFTRYDTLAGSSAETLLLDTQRTVYAYRNVKFFKSDMQGKCDSMIFTSKDSTMRLFGKPVLWNEKSQLTADKISIVTGNNEIQSMLLENTAFIASQEDSTRFNQIKGRRMTGYFSKSQLYRVDVEGNGQTLYFVRDGKEIVGVNKVDCPRLSIFISEEEVKKITFFSKPDATLFPPVDLSPREALLKDFRWRGRERPVKKADIFVD